MDTETTAIVPGSAATAEEPSAPVVRTVHRFTAGKVRAQGGGRPPGSKNKIESPQATAVRMGFSPIEVMINIIRNGFVLDRKGAEVEVSIEQRNKMLCEVAPYIVSKAPTAVVAKHDHTHTHVDMTRIMMDPQLAEAAERLALAMASEPDPEALVFDADFEDISDSN